MPRFYCSPRCKHGNIVKCELDAEFGQNVTFTNEMKFPVCPRFEKEKEVKTNEN